MVTNKKKAERYIENNRPRFQPKGSFGRAWKAYAKKLEHFLIKLAEDAD